MEMKTQCNVIIKPCTNTNLIHRLHVRLHHINIHHVLEKLFTQGHQDYQFVASCQSLTELAT